MARIDKEIEELFNRIIGNDEEERELAEAIKQENQAQWITDEGIGTCGFSDINNGFARYARGLPDYQGRPIIEAIRQGSQNVTIGDRTFTMPSSQAAPAEQAITYVNMVEQTTTHVDQSRDTTVLNEVTNVVSGIGNTVTTSVGPTVSGDGAVVAGDDIRAPVTTGAVGGNVTNIDESLLAGTNFGASGNAAAAGGDAIVGGQGGTAVGPGGVGGDINVADRGGTIAEDGGVAAGGLAGTVGQAATTGGIIDQSADQTQLAGGNIDQSADTDVDVNIADASGGGTAQVADQEVDLA